MNKKPTICHQIRDLQVDNVVDPVFDQFGCDIFGQAQDQISSPILDQLMTGAAYLVKDQLKEALA